MTGSVDPVDGLTRQERMAVIMELRGLSIAEIHSLLDYWETYYNALDAGDDDEHARHRAMARFGYGAF